MLKGVISALGFLVRVRVSERKVAMTQDQDWRVQASIMLKGVILGLGFPIKFYGNNQDEQFLNNFCSDGPERLFSWLHPHLFGDACSNGTTHDVSTSTRSTRNHFLTLHTAVSPDERSEWPRTKTGVFSFPIKHQTDTSSFRPSEKRLFKKN